MLSQVVLSAAATAAPSLKNSAFLGPGVLQATRTFHTGQPHLAPVPPLPEYGGKVHHGLIPEEFFQYLYPKTGVTGPYVLGTGLILYALSKEIYVITGETITGLAVIGLYIFGVKKFCPSVAAFADKLNEQKLAQLEEAKQASIKQIQDAVDMEKAQQADHLKSGVLDQSSQHGETPRLLNIQKLAEHGGESTFCFMKSRSGKKQYFYCFYIIHIHLPSSLRHLVESSNSIQRHLFFIYFQTFIIQYF
uniref:ATP synthase subunit b n=1 Tax=Callithrix jacchus TaxID=9483 RepID=A0A8I4A631_CALJA